jgi:hypothetical protein
MSVTRHFTNILLFDSMLTKEAFKTTLIKSQGAMNFIFVRIYRTANLEYLENTKKERIKKFYRSMRFREEDIRKSSLFLLYKLKKEQFKKFLRQHYIRSSILESITDYIKWRQRNDAGMASTSLMIFNDYGNNNFCGKTLNEPLVHKYRVFEKLCNVSDIPMTHTSYIDCNSSENSRFDPFEFTKDQEESENESDVGSRFSQSVSLPNVQKLHLENSQNSGTKTIYSLPRTDENTVLGLNGKTIECTNTVMSSSSYSSDSNTY